MKIVLCGKEPLTRKHQAFTFPAHDDGFKMKLPKFDLLKV